MSFIKFIYITLLISALCEPAFSDEVPDELLQLDVPQINNVIVTFYAFDPSRVVLSESQLLTGFVKKLQEKTSYTFNQKVNPTSVGTYSNLKGLQLLVDGKNSKIFFNYNNCAASNNINCAFSGQQLTIPVAYKIERGSNDLTLQLIPPEKADLKSWTSMFQSLKKIDSSDKLFEDFKNVLAAASTVKVKVFSLAKGEAISTFKQEPIIGNFERLLGRHTSGFSSGFKYDVRKENVFSYLVGQDRVPLKVAVFPYRDGTKVVYETFLPYQIGADGSKEGFDLPEILKNDIQKILND